MLRIAKVTVTLEIVYPADVCDAQTAVGVIAEDIVNGVEFIGGLHIDRDSVTDIALEEWQAEVRRSAEERPDVTAVL